MNLHVRTLAAAAGLALLAGCSSGADEEQSGFEEPASDETVVDSESGEVMSQEPVPEWDKTSQREAVNAAIDATSAFAQPDLSQDEWFEELEPYLTADAAESHSFTDPANVPVSDVTGPGELIDDTSAYLGVVSVPTDAGDYHVTVVREDGESEWLVSELTPAEE